MRGQDEVQEETTSEEFLELGLYYSLTLKI
jgi:hypothetical protein